MELQTFTHIQLPFFAILLLLIILAKILGEIMERIGIPAMIGEISAGIILGPSLLHWVGPSADLRIISDLGVFLLMILAGFQINLDDLRNSIKGKNLWIAILGFFIPFSSGFLVGWIFQLDYILTIFLSLCISITALPVSIRILMDLGKLNSEIGKRIISAAIFNDVVALFILGIILDFNSKVESYSSLAISTGIILLKILVFILIITFAYLLFKYISRKVLMASGKLDTLITRLKSKESRFAAVMVFVLLFASISEFLGLHFVIGAFFGAIILDRNFFDKEQFEEIRKSTSDITMGFLAPIFFALIGIELNIFSITNIPLLLVVLAASFISKILGGFLGGRLAGMSKIQSSTLGIGLNARGIMELVIANIALSKGFIDTSLYSILVIMGITTTVFSPFLLKMYFNKMDKNIEAKSAAA